MYRVRFGGSSLCVARLVGDHKQDMLYGLRFRQFRVRMWGKF